MDIFQEIFKGMDEATLQYREMYTHDSEEARSLYIAPVVGHLVFHTFEFDKISSFKQTVCLFIFRSKIINQPEGDTRCCVYQNRRNKTSFLCYEFS